MKTVAREIKQQGDKLFEKRGSLVDYLQEVAENFHPLRADFKGTPSFGQDFASNLTTSVPIIAHRDLQNIICSMLRPSSNWFLMSVMRDEKLDQAAKLWLEKATKFQYRCMYDPDANLNRATNELDGDYAAFGMGVLSCEFDRLRQQLLYRTWHLRDVVWSENVYGKIDTFHRNWKPTARMLKKKFRQIAPEVKRIVDKDPYAEINCRHVIMPAENYGEKKYNAKYVSLYVDLDNDFVIEEAGSKTPIYMAPRWQTISGSQYGYSPAVIAALPDARLIQSVTLSLLEAGEMAVNPPRIAPADAIRSDYQLYAGGITLYDTDYDETKGEILRPLLGDSKGLSFGLGLHEKIKEYISEAFFLNKVSMAPLDKSMTAFEVGQRIQEYVRNALPLFGPTEAEYNGGLCNLTFDTLNSIQAFGPPEEIPQSLRGEDVKFVFESALHKAIEREKGQRFIEAKQMLAETVALDPQAAAMVNVREALREALEGIGTPVKWLRSDEEMQAIEYQAKQQQQAQQLLQTLGAGAEVAQKVGAAGESFARMQG